MHTAEQRWRLWRRAAAWLLLLGPLFYASYGFANWWAGTRAVVPSVVFDWERHIPFVAWTIFPYWSINVFYALSLFLGRTRHTIDRHAVRLLTVQIVAVTCFIIWPLKFSFGAPPADGAAGLLFDALRGFDKPYNQAPSLHIALAVILWDWYRRLLKGRTLALWVLHVWTFAICASVLTTYQHHFIDIPTGALLGVVCCWLWPLDRVVALPRVWRCTRDAQRWKLAGFYGAGALVVAALATWGGGAWLWLWWGSAALAMVALNYAGFGARGFGMQRDGRMAWPARVLSWPYRIGAAINAWAWTRALPASAEVLPGVRLGRRPTLHEWQQAGKPRIVSLCAELPVDVPAHVTCQPMLDLVTPTAAQLQRAGRLVQHARIDGAVKRGREGHAVWVCCALGFSRSAAATLAWMISHGYGADESQAAVRRARPQVVLKPTWLQRLRPIDTPPDHPRAR